MVLKVRRYGDPVLRQRATAVADVTEEIRGIIRDMVETMYDQIGIGLAAPQVGIPLRIIVMDDGTGSTRALVNPVITSAAGRGRGEEGCLSLPGIFAEVERHEWVQVDTLDGDGRPAAFESRGMAARVIQHEMDHLDGILFIDHLPPVARDRIKKRIQKDGLPERAPHSAFAL
jgi:peptide deformylase